MDPIQDDGQETAQPNEEGQGPQDAPEQQTATTPEPEQKHPSREDALRAMRESLREDEEKEESRTGIRRLMQRIFRRRRRKAEEITDAPSRLDALEFPEPLAPRKPAAKPAPETPATAEAEEAAPRATATEPGKVDFESLVRDRMSSAFSERDRTEPTESIPGQPVEEEPYPVAPGRSILTTLRQEGEPEAEETANIRQEALEDYTIAPEEPEEEQGAPLTRKLRRSWRYMRPAEKRLLIGALILVGLAAVGGGGFAVMNSLPTPTPAVTPTPRIEPVPISVSMPGGWVFPLRTCYVQDDGSWNPKDACWLNGTDVYRWVSLPYTVQLEAVVRTLKASDEIHLSMSNYDDVIYKVQSIEQVPSAQIGKLKSDVPCIYLVLTKEDSNTDWVVTAQLTTAQP